MLDKLDILFPWLTLPMKSFDKYRNDVAVVETENGDYVLLKAKAKTLDFYNEWVYVAFAVDAYKKFITSDFDLATLRGTLIVAPVNGTSMADTAMTLGVSAMTVELRKILESLTNDTDFVWYADRLYIKDTELVRFSDDTQMYVDMFGAMLTSKYLSPLLSTSLCFCSRNCYHFLQSDLMKLAADIDVGVKTLEYALIRSNLVRQDGDLNIIYYAMPSNPGDDPAYYIEIDKTWVDRWKSLGLEKEYLAQQ